MPPAEDKTTADDHVDPNLSALSNDILDMNTFSQILEMDEPDDHEFSSSIVFGFFDQAEETFKEMDEALETEDLQKLSSLGHFLKGSSATLGLWTVRDGCEKIQRYGKKENIDGTPEPDATKCLNQIKEEIQTVKVDIAKAHRGLNMYYEKDKSSDA